MMRYECRNIFDGETIATFETYDQAENFIDAATDYPDWWTIPAMTIIVVTDDDHR